MKKLLMLMSFVLLWVTYLSSQTVVTGTVADAVTKEPIPFVNVVFKGTSFGGATDFDGKYRITTSEKCDSITVSYIGFNTYTKAIKQGQEQEINIFLKQGVELKTIEIKPGENPALRILRKVIANKENNQVAKLAAYQYELYNKIEVDLNNIDQEYKNKAIFKPFAFIFDNIDSTQIGKKPSLPIFITETISDFYFRKQPAIRNEVIKASKVSGIKNESMTQFMGDMYQKIDFYDNSMQFFDKTIPSPLSKSGLMHYRYYLEDSVNIDGHRCYQLRFKPKRKQSLAFVGNVWVTDSAYAIKKIEVDIAEDANLNFVNGLTIAQSFIKVEDVWMLEKENLLVDFSPFPIDGRKKKLMGFYGKKTASYRDFKLNQPQEDDFYSKEDEIRIIDSASYKSDEFWVNNRHDSLAASEKQIYRMVDTIQTLKAYRTWIDVIEMIVTGYKVLGPVELGPIGQTYSFNNIEGHRFRFGMRTSNAFSEWIELNGHLAYGTRDKEFKYRLGYRLFLEKENRTMLEMHYKNDNSILGAGQNSFSSDNVVGTLLRFGPLRNLTREKQIKAAISRDWKKGISSKVAFYNTEYIPQGEYTYELNETDLGGNPLLKNSLTSSEIRVNVRFAYKEKFISGVFDRKSLGTKWPVIQSQYSLGIKGILGSEYDYQKFALNVSDGFNLSSFGRMDVSIEAGRVWGTLPYVLLALPGGNETYVYNKNAYNGLNFFEFATDKYATASVSHHFNGFFLNRIPLLRKLKWREVVGAKVLFGDLDAKHNQVLVLPDYVKSLVNRPYYESSVGIENIFKILRIDGVWRMAYLEAPNAVPFMIKGSLQFVF